jgi:hypothetical protein
MARIHDEGQLAAEIARDLTLKALETNKLQTSTDHAKDVGEAVGVLYNTILATLTKS